MIKVKNPAECCGCTACASVCAHDAITMQPDALGFLYPEADEQKCVNCGLCDKVCAFNDHYDTCLNLPQPQAYAARHNDMHEVETSRSGAAFIALSDYVLERGGVVYGAGYTDHFRVVHKRATTREERDEFKGSKYVQSDLRGVFRQVRRDLRSGLTVLFSGTACQTAGLNAYVGRKSRENLVLVDIVCHGTPGPYLWRDYLDYLEKKQRAKVCWVNFRDKQEFGWAAHRETFKFEGQESKESYPFSFYQSITFRRSCARCPYCNTRRPSDVTLADYWGWERTDPDINRDDRGVSLVLVNTPKGRELFEAVRERMKVIPAQLENCLQPNLQSPSGEDPRREAFERDYVRRGFAYVAEKYGEMPGVYHSFIVVRRKFAAVRRRLLSKSPR